MALTPDQIKLRDVMKVEEMVGAHMLFLMLEQACAKEKLEVRSDVISHLNQATAVPLSGLDDLSVSRIAQRVDDVAMTILRDMRRPDFTEGAYTCAMFNLILIDEGFLADPQAQNVLVSMLIMDDVKNTDRDTVGAENVKDPAREPYWKGTARDMLRQAQTMGLYTKQTSALRQRAFQVKLAAGPTVAPNRHRDDVGRGFHMPH